MSDIRAFQSGDIPAPSSTAHARAIWQRAAQSITAAQSVVVEIVDAARISDMRVDWSDLVARCDVPNVFMDPVLLRAAAAADPQSQLRVLLAWKSAGDRKRLVGVWGFAVAQPRQSVLPIRVLMAPAYGHCYLATPVIDREAAEETLDAMLDGIADDPLLPKIVTLDMMGADGSAYAALTRVLAWRSAAPAIFGQWQRPKLASWLDGRAYLEAALSGSTRKKLRQHRRKLAEKGALTTVIASEPEAVRRALEEFLAMEASGWKGREGTALLNDKADAAFMRGAVSALAGANCASIHSLYLDGKPVSMQIVVRSGAAGFTWKTTYDEACHDFSPGMLLLEDYTAAFLADKSIGFVDSCAFDDTSYMSAWTERQPVADLWFDARRGGSTAFRVLATLQKDYRSLRAAAKGAYLAWRQWRKTRKK